MRDNDVFSSASHSTLSTVADQHREYVQFIELKLAELRPRLHQNAFLTLDNVNIDCGGVNEEQVAVNGAHQWTAHQCQEYPLAEAYHFLVVEDSYVLFLLNGNVPTCFGSFFKK